MKQILKLHKKNQKGITLIALVITIIVLIILAMITIAMLTGENGLLNKSVEAKIENSHGEVRERLQLETNVYLSEKLEGKYKENLLTYLQDKGFVKAGTNKVLIDNLSQGGKSIITGKGTVETDIYKLEEKTEETSKEKEYSINYYDEKGNTKEIGILKDGTKLSNTESEEGDGLIHFTIHTFKETETQFTAEKGMTWKEFSKSDLSLVTKSSDLWEGNTFAPNPVTYHAVWIPVAVGMSDWPTFGDRDFCALRNEPTIQSSEFGYSWDNGATTCFRLFKTQEATVENMCNPDDVIEPNWTYYTISRTWWAK